MIKEYREVFQQSASVIPDYKKISQIELAEKYLEKGPNADAYLSALILRYWNIIEKMLYKDYGLYDEKEAYDWFMDSLLYAITYKPWQDPKSGVYQDPKAIEKVLNTCIKCSRANWFQASNRHKRKINHNTSSLEALSEEFKDSYLPRELTVDLNQDGYTYLIEEAFNKQQYLFALIVDVIVHDISLDKVTDTKSLILVIKRSIRTLPVDYYKIFAKNYGFDPQQVEKSFSFIYNMSDQKLKQSIENYIYKLRNILKRED